MRDTPPQPARSNESSSAPLQPASGQKRRYWLSVVVFILLVAGAILFSRHREQSHRRYRHPPAIAPTIRNGSAPLVTASGNGVSGGSRDKSSLHAKNLTNGRRFRVS